MNVMIKKWVIDVIINIENKEFEANINFEKRQTPSEYGQILPSFKE